METAGAVHVQDVELRSVGSDDDWLGVPRQELSASIGKSDFESTRSDNVRKEICALSKVQGGAEPGWAYSWCA